MFGKFRGGFHNQRQRKGSNIQSNITITLEEAYRGGEFDVEINTTIKQKMSDSDSDSDIGRDSYERIDSNNQ